MTDVRDLIGESVAVLQQLDRDLLAIEMTKTALAAQEREIHAIPLLSRDSGAPISKSDFKELGAAKSIIDQVGIEALIGLTANAIETFSIRLKRHLDVEWEAFRRPMDEIRHAERPRLFRALNNIYKHQEGYIEAVSSRSAKFLVDAGYFEDRTYLRHLSASCVVPDLELALYEAFAHLYSICFKCGHFPDRFAGLAGDHLVQKLKEHVVYSVIRPTVSEAKS